MFELSESATDLSKDFSDEIKKIEVVVAYCRSDLNWMYEHILAMIPNQKKATVKISIMSKCDEEALVPNFIDDYRVLAVNIVKLPNVGGCDYAYAHFINSYASTAKPDDAGSSLILFIKDTPRITSLFNFPYHQQYCTYRGYAVIWLVVYCFTHPNF